MTREELRRDTELMERALRGELGAKGLRHVRDSEFERAEREYQENRPKRVGRMVMTEKTRREAASAINETLGRLASGLELYTHSEKTVTGRAINFASAGLYLARGIFNEAVEGGLAERRKRKGEIDWSAETAGILKGLFSSKPWRQFKEAITRGKPGDDLNIFRNLARSDPEWKKTLAKVPGGAGTLDTITELGLDTLAGKGQSKFIRTIAIPALQKVGTKAEESVPFIRRVAEKQRAYDRARHVVGVEEAAAARLRGRAADALEESRRTSRKLQKQGVKLRAKNPATGRPLNVYGQHEADLLEAGSFGARHEPIAPKGQAPGEVYQRQQRQLPKLKAKLPERDRAARKAIGERVKATHAKNVTEQAYQGSIATQQTVMGHHAQAEAEAIRKGQMATQSVKDFERANAAATNREQIARSLRAAQKTKEAAAVKAEAAVGPLQQATEAARVAFANAEARIRLVQRNRTGMDPASLREALSNAVSSRNRALAQLQGAQREYDRAAQQAKAARSAVPTSAILNRADREAAALRTKADAAKAARDAARGEATRAATTRRGLTVVVKQAGTEVGRAKARFRIATEQAKEASSRAQAATHRYAQTQANVRQLTQQTSTPAQASNLVGRRQQQVPIIRQSAQQAGIPFRDLTRTAGEYRKVLDEVGEGLVDVGLMSEEAYKKLKRGYLPRLYEVSARSPKEARKLLDQWVKGGIITPEVAAELGHASNRKNWRGLLKGGKVKPRELVTFEERNLTSVGRAAQPEAAPAVSNYVTRATSAIADRKALRVLANDPNLAVTEQAVQAGQRPEWLARALPLEVSLSPKAAPTKVYLHPGVGQYFAQRQWVQDVAAATPEGWKNLNATLRKIWVSAPPTAVNNAVGNYALGQSAASMHGADYTLLGYGRAVNEVRGWRKSGNTRNPYLQEATTQTELFNDSGSLIPRESRPIGGGFGVETPVERLKQAPGKAYEGYSNVAYRDVEHAGRFYLYQQLRRAGKSVDEASVIARNAMVDYGNVSPALHLLERNNVLPFATFPVKSARTIAKTAAMRPDLFYTFTGERARRYTDRTADERAVEQGKKPYAAARREAGLAGPTQFPIPGRFDASGQPLYAQAPFLAPFASALMAGPGGDVAESLQARAEGAFPLVNALTSLARNQRFNPYTGEYSPIVPPGSIPPGGTLGGPLGNLEAPGRFAAEAVRFVFPQYRSGERVVNALTGASTTGGEVPTTANAITQGLFGFKVSGRIGEGTVERTVRSGKEKVARVGGQIPNYVSTHANRIAAEIERNPEWTPGGEFEKKASGIVDADEVRRQMEGAQAALKDAISGTRYTEDQKKVAVPRLMNWIAALGSRRVRLLRQELQRTQPGLLPQGYGSRF